MTQDPREAGPRPPFPGEPDPDHMLPPGPHGPPGHGFGPRPPRGPWH